MRREKEAYLLAEERLRNAILGNKGYPGKQADIDRVKRWHKERYGGLLARSKGGGA